MSDSEVDESPLESDEEDEPEENVQPVKVYGKDYKLHEIRGPTKERVKNDVVPPAGVLAEDDFWDEDGNPNIVALRDHLKREGKIGKKQFMRLIDMVYDLLCAEDNVLNVDAPVTVCGDIHGQFFDLIKLFEVGGDPKTTNYLFLGDYVDRGYFAVECIILLFSYKVLYPKSFFMLRGNHECRHLTDYFTFKEECEHKYDLDIYNSVMDAFDALPLAAIMNKQFLCVHGGLSPQIEVIDDIKKIDRFIEPPPNGPLCDLLWADPMEEFSPDTQQLFEFNSVRGCSYNYSFNAVCQFLEKNKLLSVIRAHEAQDAGYRMHRKNEKTGFPSVITLFSAPNYLDHYGNKGAVLRYENNVINIRQFNHCPHPYWLPGFMNVFKWSIPFVAEKASEIISNVFNLVDDASASIQEEEELKQMVEQNKKREQLRNKVRTVSRMLVLFKKMRAEREQLMDLGALSPKGDTVPSTVPTLISQSMPTASTSVISSSSSSSPGRKSPLATSLKAGDFEAIKTIDIVNEARPDGFDKTVQEMKAYQDTIQYQRRKSSRELSLTKKAQEDFRAIKNAAKKGPQQQQQEKPQTPQPLPKVIEEKTN